MGSTTSAPARSSAPAPISVTRAATNLPYYAAFQSNNDRIVSTSDGIFLSYFSNWSGTNGGSRDTGNAVVVRSTDGGSTWTTLANIPDIVGKHAPATMTADASGNVYAFMESEAWGGDDGRIYMFPRSANFANDGSDYLELPSLGVGANKFAMTYDASANKIFAVSQYYMAQVTTTCQSEIGSRGSPACSSGAPDSLSDLQWAHLCDWSSCQPGVSGSVAQYPLVYAGRDSADAHVVVLGWTEEAEASGSNYYDNRFIFSGDDGATWHGTSGATICATGCTYGWQMDTGPNGPSFLINRSSETGTKDGPWMDSLYSQDGYFMFVYSRCARDICSPHEAPEYARFSRSGGNATLVNRILAPSCLSTGSVCPTNGAAGGFFSGAGTTGAPIYYTTQQSSSSTKNRIVTIASTDSGASWHDQAASGWGKWNYPYAVSGGPTLASNGQIVGAFVDMTGRVGGSGYDRLDDKTLDFFHT